MERPIGLDTGNGFLMFLCLLKIRKLLIFQLNWVVSIKLDGEPFIQKQVSLLGTIDLVIRRLFTGIDYGKPVVKHNMKLGEMFPLDRFNTNRTVEPCLDDISGQYEGPSLFWCQDETV